MSWTPCRSAEPPARTVSGGETAEYCRAKAHDLVQAALDRATGNERSLMERNAAAWAMRADQLQRSERRLAAPAGPGSEADHVRL
jgi:hypothetical protein